MEVVGHGAGLHAEELLQVGECFFEEDHGLVVLEIADVLA